MTEWADEYAAVADRPRTLVMIAEEDTSVGGEELARRTAAKWGAEVEVLGGVGHWWMMQDPVRGAAVLRRFVAA